MKSMTTKQRLESSRRILGAASAALGLLFLSITVCLYLRYASAPLSLHAQERIQHAHGLAMLWQASFYSSIVLFVLSLLGLGWGRWAGLIFNAAAFVCALMTLGALCGPFGC